MRDLFFKLFSKSFFNTGISVTAFSIPHIVYLLLIFGGIALAAYLIKDIDMQAKDKVLRFLAYAMVISYVSDFFVHDFVYGGLEMDKLPFHLCTVMCPVAAFTQFNKKFEKFLEPVSVHANVGP